MKCITTLFIVSVVVHHIWMIYSFCITHNVHSTGGYVYATSEPFLCFYFLKTTFPFPHNDRAYFIYSDLLFCLRLLLFIVKRWFAHKYPGVGYNILLPEVFRTWKVVTLAWAASSSLKPFIMKLLCNTSLYTYILRLDLMFCHLMTHPRQKQLSFFTSPWTLIWISPQTIIIVLRKLLRLQRAARDFKTHISVIKGCFEVLAQWRVYFRRSQAAQSPKAALVLRR